MVVAVANRPAEQFETQVPMPDWQLTPEEEVYGDTAIDDNSMQPMMVDENGMPIAMPPQQPGYPPQQPMVRPDGTGEPTQQDLDRAFPPQQLPQQLPQQQQQQRQPQPVPPPQPRPSNDPLAPAPDGSEPRPGAF
jgi:penicillin-binding protein 1A